MAGITIGGLATGLDSASIISKLLAVERLPEQVMQATQKTDQAQIDIYNQLQTSLTSLQTITQGMSTSASFKGMISTVTNSSVATVTAASTAAAKQVWVLRDGAAVAVAVVPGISDGRMTEVVSGELQAGMLVITDQKAAAAK